MRVDAAAPDRTYKVRGLVAGIYPHDGWWEAVKGMLNRMAISEQKYGPVEESTTDCKAELDRRWRMYLDTGNTEWLLDAANFAIIEFLKPSRAGAFFEGTDEESPGLIETAPRKWKGTL